MYPAFNWLTESRRRCFLDLDGCLVDFVGGACDFHRIPNPYDSPTSHGVYLLENLVGMSKEEFFSPLGEEFWADLKPTKECFELVEFLEKVFGADHVCLLTSPVLTSGCAEGKIRWIRQHLPQYARDRRFLIGMVKEFAASPKAWLVDDSDKNVERFREWGGRTITIPRPWNSLHKLSGDVIQHVDNELRAGWTADLCPSLIEV